MKLTKFLISSASTFAIVGTLGFAVAQTTQSPGAADNNTTTQSRPMTNADGTPMSGTNAQGRPMTNADGSMMSGTTTPGSTPMNAKNNRRNGDSSMSSERVARADRN